MRNIMHLTRRAFVAAGTFALLGCTRKGIEQNIDSNPVGEGTSLSDDLSDTVNSIGASSEGSGKILVAYYSRADENYAGNDTEWLKLGHTKVMAGYIAEALNADVYEIVPTEPYPEGYDDCCDVALEEQRGDVRPVIADELPKVAAYTTVFIGCPVWWGSEPMIVRTFVEAVDLSGKVIVPFTTHGGSGLGSVPENLQAAIPDAQFLEGYAVAGTAIDDARDEVVSWVQNLLSSL